MCSLIGRGLARDRIPLSLTPRVVLTMALEGCLFLAAPGPLLSQEACVMAVPMDTPARLEKAEEHPSHAAQNTISRMIL